MKKAILIPLFLCTVLCGAQSLSDILREDCPKAPAELLNHFRSRPDVKIPVYDLEHITISEAEQRWADEALEHRFFVHVGYQPSYFYGKDIDWTFWPVHDNELRWQLHRMKWWVPMGKAYRLSGDEKYAREWVLEYLDWIAKNPVDGYDDSRPGPWETADNMYFAWRPLEASDRMEKQLPQFELFKNSPSFTPEFLEAFLLNYWKHCDHVLHHFSDQGNHLLFEAQRLLYASIFFPEFKDAQNWKSIAVDILTREIEKQVYADGMQYELDPHYHIAAINIFFNALEMCSLNGAEGVFPEEYTDKVHKMVEVARNFMYPDYSTPLFSDNREHDPAELKAFLKRWRAVFSEDAEHPRYLSKACPQGGFYFLRNGWDMGSTIMVLKAGPKGEWHNQPDNGTFEYWRKGRNFFPDSGCYVYGGNKEVEAQRNWFKQSRIHNTVTLDSRNFETRVSTLRKFRKGLCRTTVEVEQAPYEGFHHIRRVVFRRSGKVTITDIIEGEASGTVNLNLNLVENDWKVDGTILASTFDDGNNITIKVQSSRKDMVLTEREGRISRRYREYNARPSFSFDVKKSAGEKVIFKTIIK